MNCHEAVATSIARLPNPSARCHPPPAGAGGPQGGRRPRLCRGHDRGDRRSLGQGARHGVRSFPDPRRAGRASWSRRSAARCRSAWPRSPTTRRASARCSMRTLARWARHEVLYARLLCEASTLPPAARARLFALQSGIAWRLRTAYAARCRARRGAGPRPGRARQHVDCAHQPLPDESRPVRARRERGRGARRRAEGAMPRDHPTVKDPR